MKLLYVTTIGLTMGFFKSIVRTLLDEGHRVDLACNEQEYPAAACYREWGCEVFPLDCSRSPFSPANLRAVRQIRRLAAEGGYDLVHCHTPVAGVCTRFACRKLRRDGLRVFYTAHGFHFYKGAPLQNWLLYYPVEKLCARMTDTIVTINREDYELARRKLRAERVVRVPGVGVDLPRFRDATADRDRKRDELGIPRDAFLLISAGELNVNKNHQIGIRTLARLQDPSVHYLVAGAGPQKDRLEALAASLGVSAQVHLIGFRDDLPALYKTADLSLFPSIREGLGLAAIEAMAAGLPLLCTDNRGTREYAPLYRLSGYSCLFRDEASLAALIERLRADGELYRLVSERGLQIAEEFSQQKVNALMRQIYGLS